MKGTRKAQGYCAPFAISWINVIIFNATNLLL